MRSRLSTTATVRLILTKNLLTKLVGSRGSGPVITCLRSDVEAAN